MRSFLSRGVVGTSMGALLLTWTGCGSSSDAGGGGTAPVAVTVAVDLVTLTGLAGWPGATTLEVWIDGAEVPVTDGVWTHSVPLVSTSEQTLEVAVVADGVTVAVRQVVVRR